VSVSVEEEKNTGDLVQRMSRPHGFVEVHTEISVTELH